jgi:uncharacterized coiled-coil DUF342 family protein
MSRARALFQKLQEWLAALRKVYSTSRRVDQFSLEISHLHEEVLQLQEKARFNREECERMGLEISHLHEKARFSREECERISALYDSVTARIASLEQRMANQEQRLSGIGEPGTHREKSPRKQIQEEKWSSGADDTRGAEHLISPR